MFTGIVEITLPVSAIAPQTSGVRLTLERRVDALDGTKVGDSIAVNGCCLTVVDAATGRLVFDVVTETLRLTNLGSLAAGTLVNVERALAFGARMDGHLMQGHVDGTGVITTVNEAEAERRITIEAGPDFCALCVHKGSVAVDGVSLTIAALSANTLTIAVIPHTWRVTNFHARRTGDRVNLEADILGKYVKAFSERTVATRDGKL